MDGSGSRRRRERSRRRRSFDERGYYVGRVASPVPVEKEPYPLFGADRVTGVTLGEFDVPYIVQLRIVRGCEPAHGRPGFPADAAQSGNRNGATPPLVVSLAERTSRMTRRPYL